ncbi:hypothetical protein HG1285_17529 [Hydrogenivirga sp. 128-5-R1-1]|nr:hypothetical protein HG1285_17529 [Hydrogenivirga sp. 128-5-R1-1]
MKKLLASILTTGALTGFAAAGETINGAVQHFLIPFTQHGHISTIKKQELS